MIFFPLWYCCAFAQVTSDNIIRLQPAEILSFQSLRPRSISQDAYDSISLQPTIIQRIIVTGNERTRLPIILRELTFHEQDTLPMYVLESAIERSRQNLMNTGLFNFVEIHYFQTDNGETVLHIELTERWYLWPSPVFEIADRNLNEWWQRKDLSRTNFGAFVRQENLTGRDDILQVQALFGYTRRYGVYYTRPYINRKMNIGLTVGFYTTRVKEVAWGTTDNKLDFFKNPDAFQREETQGYLRLTKRSGLYDYFSTTLDYRYSQVSDTVIALNPNYFFEEQPVQQHLGLTWSYRYDNRDYQPYAQNGQLFEIEVNKTGLGLLRHEPNLMYIASGVRIYRPLARRWSMGAALKGRITQYRPSPFFNQRALGYGSDYIRGYDLYVMNGQDYLLFRSNLRYALVTRRVYELPYVRSGKFKRFPLAIYLNGFFDAGRVEDPVFGYRNPLSNNWQYGTGSSLDIVTYYDIVLRFEYAFNKMGEHGFFLRMGSVF